MKLSYKYAKLVTHKDNQIYSKMYIMTEKMYYEINLQTALTWYYDENSKNEFLKELSTITTQTAKYSRHNRKLLQYECKMSCKTNTFSYKKRHQTM